MYIAVLWTLQFVLLAGGKVWKYDMGQLCGQKISLGSDRIRGIEVLMYMTADLVPRRGCRLQIDKSRSQDYLHFYFSEINMASCQDIALHLSTGTSLTSTSIYSELCGPKSHVEVNVHHTSAVRYLFLDLTWSNSNVRGTVFRFVANVYTCGDCPAAGRCDNGWCAHADLKRERSYDFCPESFDCSANGTADDENEEIRFTSNIFALVSVIPFVIFTCLIFRHFRDGRGGAPSGLEKCRCCFSALECCCEGLRDCLRGIRGGSRRCLTRARNSLNDCPCKMQQVSQTTTNNTASASTIEMATNTEPPEDVSTVDNSNDEGEPPSYAAAVATPYIPTAPPSYQTAVDTPPEYNMALANETFYGVKN